jgi:hypothetical protein
VKTGGRKRGTQNKTTSLLKDAVLRAAEVQGDKISKDKKYPGLVKYLVFLAAEYPGPFSSLLGRVLPTQIGGVTDEGDAVNIQIVFSDEKPIKTIEQTEPLEIEFSDG